MANQAHLPPIYTASGSSEYRKRIAAFAKPLEPEVKSMMVYGRQLLAAMPARNTIDLQGLKDMKRLAKFDPRLNALIIRVTGTGRTGTQTAVALFTEFQRKGVVFDVHDSKLYLGPILGMHKLEGLETFAISSEKGETSMYLGERRDKKTGEGIPARLLINMAKILENAVWHINLFRHNELEPISSLLTKRGEGENTSAEVLKDRVNRLTLSSRREFERLMGEIGSGESDVDINDAFARVYALKFGHYMVKQAYSEDEVQHTINLCNAIARSTAVFQIMLHREIEMMEKQPQMTDYGFKAAIKLLMPHLEMLAALIEIAYCNPVVRIEALSQDAICGMDKTPIMRELNRNIRISATSDFMRAAHEIISCSLEEFQRSAKEILSRMQAGTLAEKPDELISSDVIEQIAKTEFITRETLPTAAEIWNTCNPQ